MVKLEPLLTEAEQDAKVTRDVWHLGQADEVIAKRHIENHARLTGSTRAQDIVANWNTARTKFVKVFPNEYRRALGELAAKGKKIAA
jgi:glutamate synthase domain-containing protein 3